MNPYIILGISQDASEEEIKAAYRRLAKQYHPDMNPGNEYAAEMMNQINAAYDMLKNPSSPEAFAEDWTDVQAWDEGRAWQDDWDHQEGRDWNEDRADQGRDERRNRQESRKVWYYGSAPRRPLFVRVVVLILAAAMILTGIISAFFSGWWWL